MKTRNDIWLGVYILVFIAIFQVIYNSFFDETPTFIVKIVIGIAGGLIGYLIANQVKDKNLFFKLSILLLVVVLPVIIIASKGNIGKVEYKSCEVCGYIAVDNDGFCNSCFSETWEIDSTIWDYDNHDDWLKDMQLETFALDSINQKNIFILIESDMEFERDSLWHPLITIEDLKESFDVQIN
jgi:hypothetical protein